MRFTTDADTRMAISRCTFRLNVWSICGDLMAGTRGVSNPTVDYSAGGRLRDWPATLDGVLKLDIDTVIPGHGAVTNKEGLIAHRNKVQAIRDRIGEMVHHGKSKEDIGKEMVSVFDFKPINMAGLDGMIAEWKKLTGISPGTAICL